MRYLIEYTARVKYELRELRGLSREGRNKLFANLDWLKDVSDDYRANPENRTPDHPNRFVFGNLFSDCGRLRYFLFGVDDSAAAAGVLRLLTVEDGTDPPV